MNSAETAVYFQVSEGLNWNKDEIPEVCPFYSHMLIGRLIHLLQFCSVFSWQRAEAIDNRRKSSRGPIVEDMRGSRQKGGNLMFTLNYITQGLCSASFRRDRSVVNRPNKPI